VATLTDGLQHRNGRQFGLLPLDGCKEFRTLRFYFALFTLTLPCDRPQVSTSVSDVEVDSLSPDRDDGDESSKVARVIGNLPIAEYEGSPRRYGVRQTDSPQCSSASEQPTNVHPTLVSAHSLLGSPSIYSPRPGFPQVSQSYHHHH